MKLFNLILLLTVLSSLFVVGCTSQVQDLQPSDVEEIASLDDEEISAFVEEDFIFEDDSVEIGELI